MMRELDGWMVALLVKTELNGWMVALLVGRELDDWMVVLLVRAGRLNNCAAGWEEGRLDGGAAGESWKTGWWRCW